MPRFPDIPPSRSSKMQMRQPIKAHRFGDGHVRYIRLGVHTSQKEWSLRWTALTEAESTQIVTFLEGNDAHNIFDWTPPGASTSAQYVCLNWTLTPQLAGRADIDAIFAEHS